MKPLPAPSAPAELGLFGTDPVCRSRLSYRLTLTVAARQPKACGLSPCWNALALLHTFGPERLPSGQVISAAADRKQARIAFEEAGGIIATTPQLGLAAQIQDFKNRIVHPKSRAAYEAISCDAATNYRRTPVFALVDELWAHKKIDLWHAIRTGLTKVAGSLLVITTTAGRGSHTPDSPIYEYARKVASGEIEDPSFLPIIFETPRDCDWLDGKTWAAVNPGLQHGYPDIDGLRQLAREAKERPADRDAFQQFHLGIRQEHSASPFIDLEMYDEGAAAFDLEDMEGRQCWLAVDLSSNSDLTVIVACWRDGEDGYIVWPWFFCPRITCSRAPIATYPIPPGQPMNS